MQSERIPRASIYGRDGKTKFEISSGFEAKPLAMNGWLGIKRLAVLPDQALRTENKFVSGKLAQEELRAHRPEQPENGGQFKGRDAVNAEHFNGISIVAEHHRPTCARSPPKALLAKRD